MAAVFYQSSWDPVHLHLYDLHQQSIFVTQLVWWLIYDVNQITPLLLSRAHQLQKPSVQLWSEYLENIVQFQPNELIFLPQLKWNAIKDRKTSLCIEELTNELRRTFSAKLLHLNPYYHYRATKGKRQFVVLLQYLKQKVCLLALKTAGAKTVNS